MGPATLWGRALGSTADCGLGGQAEPPLPHVPSSETAEVIQSPPETKEGLTDPFRFLVRH